MRFASSVLVMLILFGESLHALPVPEQFKSKNAAVILGLDNREDITEADVKKAAKDLWKKWHPDQFPADKFSDADRTVATYVAQMIGHARDNLLKFLKGGGSLRRDEAHSDGPTMHPDPDNTEFAWNPTSARQNNFDWQDAFTDSTAPSGASEISASSVDRSMSGTLFNFLAEYPGLTKAILLFKLSYVSSENNSFETRDVGEVLMIVEPGNFPFIELRYMAKANEGSQLPASIGKRVAKYIRRRHAGSGGDFDGIGFGWGNYLLRALHTGHPTQPFKVVPTNETGVYRLQTDKTFMFLEMYPTGFSTPYVLTLIDDDISPRLYESKKLAWRNIELEQEQVNLIPWFNRCESDLGEDPK